MNKFIIKGILTVIAIFAVSAGSVKAQQNIQFTQYIFNSLSVNPAYAGYKEEWFAQMGLRAQWVGIDDAPKTGQVSIDGVLDPDNKKMGIGFQITADKLGPQSSNSAYLNYAYRLPLNSDGSTRLSFGLGAGISQYGIDYSKLNPIDGTDQEVNRGTTRGFIPDTRFGVYFSTSRWFLGASMMDLLAGILKEKNHEIIRHNRHMYFIGGGMIEMNEDIKLRPSVMVKEDFKGPTSLDVNTMIIFDERFWIGYAYRTGVKLWNKDYDQNQNLSPSNSIGAIAQFFVNDKLRIGYSYDYNLNKLNTLQSGSHEITLGLTFPKHIYRSLSPRYF